MGSTTFVLGLLQESIDPPAGGITGALLVVPEDATTGCEAADYAGLTATGKIVVVRRGGCTFEIKADLAIAAGAASVVISNNPGGADLINGTLGNAKSVPVGYVDVGTGDAPIPLNGQTATAEPSMTPRRAHQPQHHRPDSYRPSRQRRHGRGSPGQRPGRPGINDNGSGSAGLLEVALKLGSSPRTNNAFASAGGARRRRSTRIDGLRAVTDLRAATRYRDVPELRHDRLAECRLLRLRR